MLKLKMPECFVTESEIVGEPCAGRMNGAGWGTQRRIEWDQLVRDQDGDVVFVFGTGVEGIAARLTEFLGRVIAPVFFIGGPTAHIAKQAALALPEGEALDSEELAAVVMAAWTNHNFHPAIRRLKSESIGDHIAEYTGVPCIYHDKEFARTMASVIGKTHNRPVRMVRDGSRWGLIIRDGTGINSQMTAELAGIHRVMERYDLTPKDKEVARHYIGYECYSSHDFAAQMAAKAKSEDDRDKQRQRIEDAVSAILERLGGPAGAAPDSVLSPVGEVESTPEDKLAATVEANGGLMAAIDAPRKRPAVKSVKARAKGKKKAA